MAARVFVPRLESMKISKSLLLATLLPLAPFLAQAQTTPYLYRITLKGTCYETNATGAEFAALPLTDQILLDDAAQAGGVSPSTLALVYHIQTSGLGDTLDIVDANTGSTLVNLFGFYFGDDSSLGRTAATNSTMTEIKRLDYLYTLNNYTYTSWNSHSMGASFTNKRFLTDTNGNQRAVIDGQMQWIVNPEGSAGTKICTASFTTTVPFVAGQAAQPNATIPLKATLAPAERKPLIDARRR
jgi:hypothetical protein